VDIDAQGRATGDPASPLSPEQKTPGSWRTGYWMVLALIGLSYGLCAAQRTPEPSALAFLVQLLTVAVTLQVAGVQLRLRRVGWIVLSVAATATVVVQLLGAVGHVLDIVLSGASMIAYLVAPIAIINQQLKRRHVDGQTLLASVAAYVMVGMFFTFVYNLIYLMTGVPVFGEGQSDALTSQLFFSFTTLTTTGYGDVVPVTALLQSVAIAEALTGQLFLVIAVARVVSGWQPTYR
jgi:Ion channel